MEPFRNSSNILAEHAELGGGVGRIGESLQCGERILEFERVWKPLTAPPPPRPRPGATPELTDPLAS